MNRPSAGIVGDDGDDGVWAGNPRIAAQMGASVDHPVLQALAAESQTVIYAGRDARVLGAVTIGAEVGLRPDDVHADMLPED